jgi:hypothetical protein
LRLELGEGLSEERVGLFEIFGDLNFVSLRQLRQQQLKEQFAFQRESFCGFSEYIEFLSNWDGFRHNGL